jgi:hypothetical protein
MDNLWTAAAACRGKAQRRLEHSGDGAFGCGNPSDCSTRFQSGVALHLLLQSKIAIGLPVTFKVREPILECAGKAQRDGAFGCGNPSDCSTRFQSGVAAPLAAAVQNRQRFAGDF